MSDKLHFIINEKEKLDDQIVDLENLIIHYPRINWFQQLISATKRDQARNLNKLKQQYSDLKIKQIEYKGKINELTEEKECLIGKINQYQSEIKNYQDEKRKYINQGIVISNDIFWKKENYESRQSKTPWLTDRLNHLRAKLFLQAMQVHKIFICLAEKPISNHLRLFANRKQLNSNHDLDVFNELWETIHLIVPVISTTFASVGSMYRESCQGSIGHLFIDEAGQSVPQAAVGALYRTQNAVIVGDPLQVEPVTTLDDTILRDIQKYYNLDQHYLSKESSVQGVADHANPYGTYKEDGKWIGTPLWVHRRCSDPMFTIANKIAYEERMVQAKVIKPGKIKESFWIHQAGKANVKQYVESHGDRVVEVLKPFFECEELPNVYIITPFTEVKVQLKYLLRKSKDILTNQVTTKEYQKWVDDSVGTVHTFQGKEAESVIFVIGTDDSQEGAINWVCSTPNIINVAVTRAKSQLIVIGDKNRLKTKPFFETLEKLVDPKN